MQDFAVHQSDSHPVEAIGRMRICVRDSYSGSTLPGVNRKDFQLCGSFAGRVGKPADMAPPEMKVFSNGLFIH
jgi:hypothetical protein